VGAVAVGVTGRVELVGEELVDGGVPAPAGVVVLRADELLVAQGGVELLAWGALAIPAGDLLVDELAAGVAVADAGVLGPDA